MLALAIVVLALADGLLHAALNQVLFRGNFFEPVGGPQPFPLPLNQLFTLNALGYLLLVLAFWFGRRRHGRWRWLVPVIMMVYAAASIVGWAQIGMPNPMGLGYVSKAIEVALIVALLAHLRGVVAEPEAGPMMTG